MPKNTSVTLGERSDPASLRQLEEHEQKVQALRRALIDGEESGADQPLDMAEIKQAAGRTSDGLIAVSKRHTN